MKPLTVHIIYNHTNTYGLADDVIVIERLLKKLQDSIGQTIQKPKLFDIRSPLHHCDIQFHLEIPIFSAIPWAHTNVLLLNPEQWSYAFDAYVHAFDALLFRDSMSASSFREDFQKKGLRNDHIHVLSWCAAWQPHEVIVPRQHEEFNTGFACFLAGSSSKYEYVKKVIPHWQLSDPSLTIYTTRSDFMDSINSLNLPNNVRVVCKDMDSSSRYRTMSSYRGHLICSQGEAYSYAAANAEVAGVFSIMNSLPVFDMTYSSTNNNSEYTWLSNTYRSSDNVRYQLASPSDNIRQELEQAFVQFRAADWNHIRQVRQMKFMDSNIFVRIQQEKKYGRREMSLHKLQSLAIIVIILK